MLEIPESAIRCFETWSKTRVTFYDFSGIYKRCFCRDRHYHYAQVCESVKAAGGEKICHHFDRWDLIQTIWRYRNGGIKICRAGVLDFIMPLYSGEFCTGMMLAGARKPPLELPYDIACYRADVIRPVPELEELPQTDEAEMRLLLEGLRQLAARLTLWAESEPGETEKNGAMSRAAQIHLLAQRRCRIGATLDDFAQYLHLSRSRVAHVIREETGQTMLELIHHYRLQFACGILEHSDHSIAKIAQYCGFTDASHFHRLFQQKFSMTPGEYRRDTHTELKE